MYSFHNTDCTGNPRPPDVLPPPSIRYSRLDCALTATGVTGAWSPLPRFRSYFHIPEKTENKRIRIIAIVRDHDSINRTRRRLLVNHRIFISNFYAYEKYAKTIFRSWIQARYGIAFRIHHVLPVSLCTGTIRSTPYR